MARQPKETPAMIEAEKLFVKPEPEQIEPVESELIEPEQSETIDSVVMESEPAGIGHNDTRVADAMAEFNMSAVDLALADEELAERQKEVKIIRKELTAEIANGQLRLFTMHMLHWNKHHDWTTLAGFMKITKPLIQIRLALQHLVPNIGWSAKESRFYSLVEGEKLRIDQDLLAELIDIQRVCDLDKSNPFLCDNWKKYFPDNRIAQREREDVIKSATQSAKTQLKNAKKAGVVLSDADLMQIFRDARRALQ